MPAKHEALVVKIGQIEKHTGADTLGITMVHGGYTVVVRLSDWTEGQLGIYIEPETLLPNKEEYSWLDGHLRIKAKSIRGIVSYGLLLHAPEGAQEGQDMWDVLELTHYEPEMSGDPGVRLHPTEPPPYEGFINYDIENYLKYGRKLIPFGTQVVLTEKLHGGNMRWTYQDGKMYVKSRNYWQLEDPNNLYWKALNLNPWALELAKNNPDTIFFGEVFGNVQKLKYGATQQNPLFIRIFDIYRDAQFLEFNYKRIKEFQEMCGTFRFENYVPILHIGELTQEILDQYVSGNSTIPGANHIREGVVIHKYDPETGISIEEWDRHLGRVILKYVNPVYLEKF